MMEITLVSRGDVEACSVNCDCGNHVSDDFRGDMGAGSVDSGSGNHVSVQE